MTKKKTPQQLEDIYNELAPDWRGRPTKGKMKGEDKIFLLQVINAVRSGGHEMVRFLTTKEHVDRILRIRNEVGAEALDKELIKLKEVVYE
jgi:hypothetical protein